MEISWLQIVTLAFSSALVVKIFDLAYQDWRRRLDLKTSSHRFLDENLDPILKAVDELYGKLRSLAEEDFLPLREASGAPEILQNRDHASLLYLFATFWARLEIFRQNSLYVAIATDTRGKQLQAFLNCLESRRVRLLDRILQRAIGEVMIEGDGKSIRPLPFVAFVKKCETDANARRWLDPFSAILRQIDRRHERQHLLQYAAILHAMINTLDQDHKSTKGRPGIGNKLSQKSWKQLNYRVFKKYLAFVENTDQFIGADRWKEKRTKVFS